MITELPTITEPSNPLIDDIITEDGILCLILSKLTLREAVATSVLSPRWRHLWTYLPKLNFDTSMFDAHTISLLDANNSLLNNYEIWKLLKSKAVQFIQSANSVINQYHDGVEEFEVGYGLDKTHSHYLDALIGAAVSSKTKVLRLHLNTLYDMGFHYRGKYEFPCLLLGFSSSLEELVLTRCSLKISCQFDGLRCLKILKLYNVDVIDEDIIRLLSNCCTLEFLSLEWLPRVVTLSIPRPQTQLRELEVMNCLSSRGINIDAVNLVSLRYHGYPADLISGQSSQLNNAHITFSVENTEPAPNLDYYLNKLSRNMPHLQHLKFTIFSMLKVSDLSEGPRNTFMHLKKLALCWSVRAKMTFLHLATLLDTCPFMEEFRFVLVTPRVEDQPPKKLQKIRKMLPKHPHTCLKTILISEFYCDKMHIEFALYLLENATKLELMKIQKAKDRLMRHEETHISNLRQEAPARVELVIS